MGERLSPLKRMVFLREEPSHNKRSPPVVTVRAKDETIRMSRGKTCCKFPYLVLPLSVFFAPTRYRVVKITHSSSEVIL
jgi:hypothetical protein